MASKTNCTINGTDYYRIRKKVGMKLNKKGEWVDDIKPFYGDGKKDAERKYKEFLEERAKGTFDTSEVTLGQLAHYFTYNVLIVTSKLSKSTIFRYEGVYRNKIVGSKIYNIYMHDVTSRVIQDYYNNLKDSGVSTSQIVHINKYLSHFFKYADMDNYCKNPLPNVVVPADENTEPKEPEVFTDCELKSLLNACLNHQYGFLIIFAAATGLRKSELLGLKYDDIRGNVVNVCRQLREVVTINRDASKSSSMELSSLKSPNSVRSVTIPAHILPLLENHKEHQKIMCEDAGKQLDFVFTSSRLGYINLGNLKRSYDRLQKKIGIGPIKDFHALRRTYCTMLAKNKVPLQVAYRLMGHSDISITAKYYLFVSEDDKSDAAAAINDIFCLQNI